MKITSLFSRIPNESPKIGENSTGNNDDQTPNSKSFSSPDIIPPSPVLEKKKKIKAKRSLSYAKVDDKLKENPSLLQTHKLIDPIPKETLDLVTKTPDIPKEVKSDFDNESFDCTESFTSTICEETDFCSDLYFDDWNDSPIQK